MVKAITNVVNATIAKGYDEAVRVLESYLD